MKKFVSLPGDEVDEEKSREQTREYVKKIGKLQHKLLAESKNALLVILQGMDASGKDGVIKNVFADTYPSGVSVTSFKKPTETELDHDFLWRIHPHIPAKGTIGIFNRSHYEDVIVPKAEGFLDDQTIQQRYRQVNDFERMLLENGVYILKFFLYMTPEKQKERLEDRMTNPEKFWKHKDSDWDTRAKWDNYMEAYSDAIEACRETPWVIVPADKNWYRDYVISEAVFKELKLIDPQFPGLVTDGIKRS